MAVDRNEILAAIRRCAEENGGNAVGRERFERMTGIRESSWLGRYWTRWADAVREAGFEPGAMNAAKPNVEVLEALASLVSDLERFPTHADLKMRRRQDATFPSPGVFTRLGRRGELAALLSDHCADRPELTEVFTIASAVAEAEARDHADATGLAAGEVYLMKSGRHFKIGRSNSAGRRAYELAIQLPERLEVVHVIETDDAVGIERYWHARFADRRANGEWFALTSADVSAFKRRRFM